MKTPSASNGNNSRDGDRVDTYESSREHESGSFCKNPLMRRFFLETDTSLILTVLILLVLSRLVLGLFDRVGAQYCLASILLQVLCFALPSIIFLYFKYFVPSVTAKRHGIASAFMPDVRLRLPALISLPAVIGAALALISGALLIVLCISGGDNYSFSLYNSFDASGKYSFTDVLLMTVAYAFIPALLEEFVFRGVMCAVYERHGLFPSFVFSTLFFTVAHLNAGGSLVFIFAGMIFWLLLYATDSLYVTVTVHFIYNLFCLFGLPYINAFYGETVKVKLFVFVLTTVFLISAMIFCGGMAWLYRVRGKMPSYGDGFRRSLSFTLHELISVPADICYVIYILYAVFGSR